MYDTDTLLDHSWPGFCLFIRNFHKDLSVRFEFVRRLNTTNTNFVDPWWSGWGCGCGGGGCDGGGGWGSGGGCCGGGNVPRAAFCDVLQWFFVVVEMRLL